MGDRKRVRPGSPPAPVTNNGDELRRQFEVYNSESQRMNAELKATESRLDNQIRFIASAETVAIVGTPSQVVDFVALAKYSAMDALNKRFHSGFEKWEQWDQERQRLGPRFVSDKALSDSVKQMNALHAHFWKLANNERISDNITAMEEGVRNAVDAVKSPSRRNVKAGVIKRFNELKQAYLDNLDSGRDEQMEVDATIGQPVQVRDLLEVYLAALDAVMELYRRDTEQPRRSSYERAVENIRAAIRAGGVRLETVQSVPGEMAEQGLVREALIVMRRAVSTLETAAKYFEARHKAAPDATFYYTREVNADVQELDNATLAWLELNAVYDLVNDRRSNAATLVAQIRVYPDPDDPVPMKTETPELMVWVDTLEAKVATWRALLHNFGQHEKLARADEKGVVLWLNTFTTQAPVSLTALQPYFNTVTLRSDAAQPRGEDVEMTEVSELGVLESALDYDNPWAADTKSRLPRGSKQSLGFGGNVDAAGETFVEQMRSVVSGLADANAKFRARLTSDYEGLFTNAIDKSLAEREREQWEAFSGQLPFPAMGALLSGDASGVVGGAMVIDQEIQGIRSELENEGLRFSGATEDRSAILTEKRVKAHLYLDWIMASYMQSLFLSTPETLADKNAFTEAMYHYYLYKPYKSVLQRGFESYSASIDSLGARYQRLSTTLANTDAAVTAVDALVKQLSSPEARDAAVWAGEKALVLDDAVVQTSLTVFERLHLPWLNDVSAAARVLLDMPSHHLGSFTQTRQSVWRNVAFDPTDANRTADDVSSEALRTLSLVLVSVWSKSAPAPFELIPPSVGEAMRDAGVVAEDDATAIRVGGKSLDVLFSLAFLLRSLVPSIISGANLAASDLTLRISDFLSDEQSSQRASVEAWTDVKDTADRVTGTWLPRIRQEVLSLHAEPKLAYDQLALDNTRVSMAAFVGGAQVSAQLMQTRAASALEGLVRQWKDYREAMEGRRKQLSQALSTVVARGKDVSASTNALIDNAKAQATADNWTQAATAALDTWAQSAERALAATSATSVEQAFAGLRASAPVDEAVNTIVANAGIGFLMARVIAALTYYRTQWEPGPQAELERSDLAVEAWKRELDSRVADAEQTLQDSKPEKMASLQTQARAALERERKDMEAEVESVRERTQLRAGVLESFLDMFSQTRKSGQGVDTLNQSAQQAMAALEGAVRSIETQKAAFSGALSAQYTAAKTQALARTREINAGLNNAVNAVSAERQLMKEAHRMVVPSAKADMDAGRALVFEVDAKHAQFSAEVRALEARVKQAEDVMEFELQTFRIYSETLVKGVKGTNSQLNRTSDHIRDIMERGVDEAAGPAPYVDSLRAFHRINFEKVKQTDLLTRITNALATEVGVVREVPPERVVDISAQDYIAFLSTSYASGISAIESQGKRQESAIDRVEKSLQAVQGDSATLLIRIKEYGITTRSALAPLSRYASITTPDQEAVVFAPPPQLEKRPVAPASNYIVALKFYHDVVSARLRRFEEDGLARDDGENLVRTIQGALPEKAGLSQRIMAAVVGVSGKKGSMIAEKERITSEMGGLLEETKQLMLVFEVISESIVPKRGLLHTLHTDLEGSRKLALPDIADKPSLLRSGDSEGFRSLKLWADSVKGESRTTQEAIRRDPTFRRNMKETADAVFRSNHKAVAEGQLQLVRQQEDAADDWVKTVNSTLDTHRRARDAATDAFVKRVDATKRELAAEYDGLSKRVAGKAGTYRPHLPIVIHLENEKNGLIVRTSNLNAKSAEVSSGAAQIARRDKEELARWASDVRQFKSVIDERFEFYRQYHDTRKKLDTRLAEVQAATEESQQATVFSRTEVEAISASVDALLARSVQFSSDSVKEALAAMVEARAALDGMVRVRADMEDGQTAPASAGEALARIRAAVEGLESARARLLESQTALVTAVSETELERDNVQGRAKELNQRIIDESKRLSERMRQLGKAVRALATEVNDCLNATNFYRTGIMVVMNAECRELKQAREGKEAGAEMEALGALISRLGGSTEAVRDAVQNAGKQVGRARQAQGEVNRASSEMRQDSQAALRDLESLRSDIERDGAKLRSDVEAAGLRSGTVFLEAEERLPLPLEFQELLNRMGESRGVFAGNAALRSFDFLSEAKASIVRDRASGLFCGNRYLPLQLIGVASGVYRELKKTPQRRKSYKRVMPVFPTFSFKCACVFLWHLVSRFMEGALSQFPLKHYHTLTPAGSSTYITYLPVWNVVPPPQLTPANISEIELGPELPGFDLMPLLRDMAFEEAQEVPRDTERTTIATQDLLNMMRVAITSHPSETGAPSIDLRLQDLANFFVPTWDLLTVSSGKASPVETTSIAHRAVVRRGALILDEDAVEATKWELRWASETALEPNSVLGLASGAFASGTDEQIRTKLGMSLEALDDRVVYTREDELMRALDSRHYGSEFRFMRTTSDPDAANCKYFFVSSMGKRMVLVVTTRAVSPGQALVVLSR